jgi:serpin B
MMSQDDLRAGYDYGLGWQALRLSYAGGELAMWVLLPTESGVDPTRLLSPAVLAQLSHSAYEAAFDVGLPRWDTASDGSLTSMLRRAGMGAAFEPGAFTGITDDPSFLLADVVQKANVTVTEKGTVGAAATAAEFFVSGGPASAGAFIVNHPFAFAIVHEPTGMPLFEGVVVDPS